MFDWELTGNIASLGIKLFLLGNKALRPRDETAVLMSFLPIHITPQRLPVPSLEHSKMRINGKRPGLGLVTAGRSSPLLRSWNPPRFPCTYFSGMLGTRQRRTLGSAFTLQIDLYKSIYTGKRMRKMGGGHCWVGGGGRREPPATHKPTTPS